MNIPTCCGKRATKFRKEGGEPGTVGYWLAEGFRCKRCGAMCLPYGQVQTGEHERAAEAIRLAGIAFDESLKMVVNRPNKALQMPR